MLEWQTRANAQGFVVETVRQPDDADWTSAVLAAIERSGAARIALASISSVHWSDGGLIDIEQVAAAALRRQGALFLIDATQGAGVVPLDVKRLDPDFVIFPTYKWLLGPYGRAFSTSQSAIRTARRSEQTSAGRRDVRAENAVYFTDTGYVGNAQRFDMGERDHFISMEMAAIGMEMVAEWGAAPIAQRLAMLTDRIAEGVRDLGVGVPRRQLRAPHILCLGFAGRDGKNAGRGAGHRGHLRGAAARPHARFAPRLQRRGRCRSLCRGIGQAAAGLGQPYPKLRGVYKGRKARMDPEWELQPWPNDWPGGRLCLFLRPISASKS